MVEKHPCHSQNVEQNNHNYIHSCVELLSRQIVEDVSVVVGEVAVGQTTSGAVSL